MNLELDHALHPLDATSRSRRKEIAKKDFERVTRSLRRKGWTAILESEFEDVCKGIDQFRKEHDDPDLLFFLRPPVLMLYVESEIIDNARSWRIERWVKTWIYKLSCAWRNAMWTNNPEMAKHTDQFCYLPSIASALSNNQKLLESELNTDFVLGGFEAVRQSVEKLYLEKLTKALKELQYA